MADAREQGAWHRAALCASGLLGVPPVRLIPPRYRVERERPTQVTEGESKRAWRMLEGAWLGRPPKED